MKTNWFKRTLCSILAFVMVLGYVPATAFAAEEDGLCEHHTQHTEACGYSAAVEGHACNHAHTDECYQSVTKCVHTHGDCGYVLAVEGHGCDCQPNDSGEIVHVEGCGYVKSVAGVPCGHICSVESGCIQKVMNCQHQHDSGCGYAEEKMESSCTYACEECERERASQKNKRSEEQTLDIPTILTWEDYRYTLLADGSVSICGFEGAPEKEDEAFLVDIPSEINGAKVTEIAEKAFAENSDIEAVLLPETIESIGSGAFEDCEKLTVIAFCGDAPFFGETLVKGCDNLAEIDILENRDFSALKELLKEDLGLEIFHLCFKDRQELVDSLSGWQDRDFIRPETYTFLGQSDTAEPITVATFDNHQYAIYDLSMTWTEAKEYCEKLGGHLVTITSAEEQAFLESLLPDPCTKRQYWLGANLENGAWHWVTGETFEYSNWDRNQPDHQSGEEFAEIFNCSGDGGAYPAARYKWNDITYNNTSGSNPVVGADAIGLICEYDNVSNSIATPTVVADFNNHRYEIYDLSMTWENAKTYCEKLGGHLVTITSAEEQYFINSILPSGSMNLYWNGLSESVDGCWSWVTGEAAEYLNWAAGEPNNQFSGTENYCQIYRKAYASGAIGEWNDAREDGGTEEFYQLAHIGFICEYDSLVPGYIRYFSSWDEENQIAYFGPGDMLGSQVTEETDVSFTENPTALLGQYVLVETKPRTDGDVGPDTLISVKAVESKTGTVTAADATSVTIDSKTYSTPTSMTQPERYIDQFVLYHLYNSSLVEVEILETIEGTLISWNEQTRVLNVNLDGAAENPVVYTLSPLADEKTVSQLSSGLLLNSKVRCFTDCNCVAFCIESAKSSFSKAIYHADSLLEDEVVNLNSFIRQINQYSPAVIVLNRSDVDDWAEAWDELTTFYDTLASGDAYLKRKFKQADIYEAILLTALECSTSDDSAYAWGLATVKKEVSFTKSVLSWVKDYVELEYNWMLATNMEISSMTEGQKEQLKSALQKALEEFGVMDLVDDMTESADILGDILKVASTAEDLVEKVSVYMELWYVSDSMAAVLDEILLKIPNTQEYTPMRSAVTFCRDMIEETNRDQFKKGALLRADFMVGGKYVLSEGISFIWGKIKEKVVAQNPELNILLIAYKASHSLTNFLFNTDNTSEQLYKLRVVSQYTSYLESAILSIRRQYTENETEENANILLNAMSLLSAFAVEECDIAYDFASAVEKAPVGGGNGPDTTLKEYATGTREFYIGLNVEAATHWVYHLCNDYPERYPDYAELIDGNGGASKEVLEKALVVRITSDYTIECPVNVRAYNNNGELAANLCGDGTYVLGNLSAVQLGDRKFISIGNSGVYRIECDGYADGTMTVTIREYQGVEKIREAVFYDMEVTSDTVYDLNTKTNPLDNTIHTISLGENSISADYDSGIEKCIEHTYNPPRFIWHADYSCNAVFICTCGDDKQIQKCTVTSATTPPTATEAAKTVYTATVEINGQTYTDTVTSSASNELSVNIAGMGLHVSDEVWIDGVKRFVQSDGNGLYVVLPDANARTLVTYSYNNPNATDVHTKYPTGMKVWTLAQENEAYSATYVPELDNLLQYSGSSIRITGNKGIRMITSINQDTRNELTGNGLAGFKLLEYGTLLAQTSKLGDDPLVLGGTNVKSNYAYKKDVADPVFKYADGLIQYTNVLVGFTEENCKEDIAMRPYIKLQDENGEVVTIYGGIVYRSIGYIAYQNRKAFPVGSAAYEYVWNIIHYVYGNQYDADYKK